MAYKRYPLTRGGPARLSYRSRSFWNKLSVYIDGNLVGEVSSRRELTSGKTMPLSDGTSLLVYLQNNRLFISRNDLPLPGSPGDQVSKLSTASNVLFFICVITVLNGLYQLSRQIVVPGNTLGLYLAIVEGITLGILGYFVRRRSKPALWLAIGLYGLDGALIVFALLRGVNIPVGTLLFSLVLHGVFLYWLFQGFTAFQALEIERQVAVSLPETTLPAMHEPLGGANILLERATLMLKNTDNKLNARKLVETALQLEPDNPHAWYLSAYLEESLERQIAAFEKVLALDPNYILAMNTLERLRA